MFSGSEAAASGGRLEGVRLVDVTVRESELTDVRILGSVLTRVEVDGLVDDVVINGVRVDDYVAQELDRRHPERVLLRGQDTDTLAEGWDQLRTAWAETHARIRRLDATQLARRVDGEWSALETLRHLVFAHDAWFAGAIKGLHSWHALGLPADSVSEPESLGLDPEANPSLDDVMNVRQQQLDEVERFLSAVPPAFLGDAATPPPWSTGSRLTVLDALHVLGTEEWQHRRFCERDLAALRGEGADVSR